MDLVNRVKGILLKPKDTWQEIKGEQTTIKELYTSYAAILAAIPPIAMFIGFSILGVRVMGMYYRVSLINSIGHMIVSYVLSLVGLYIVALIIDKLAPSFSSQQNMVNAMKVAVYTMTPLWIGSILYIIPSLSPLVMLISLYGLYLFYLGLPSLMETPQEKAIGYVIVSIIVSIVVFALVGFITGALFHMGGMGLGRWY